jgi:microprocessor complex subunit DGCR8
LFAKWVITTYFSFLVINSREESDEEAMDDDFQYNEKFEMMLQDDASPSLPHGFEFATSSHQDSDQPEIINDLDNKANPFDKKIKTQSPSYLEDGDLHQNNAIENKSSNPPPLPIIDLPPLPVDKEKRPPSPPVDHQGQITLPKGVKENANSDSKATELAKNAQTISNLDKSAKQASVRNKTVDDKGFQENFKDNTSKKNSDLITMEHEENDESEDDWSDTEDIAIDLLDADLSKKALSVENTKEKKKEPHEKIRSFLVDRGKNHFTVLPEGWIQVRHFSGMPVFLHKQTRVVTLSKPYVIGPHSVKSHHIPLGSIPCLNYQKAKEEEESLRSNIESHGEVMDADVTDKENCTKEDNIDRNLDNTTTKKESTGCPMNSKESNKNSKTTVTAKFPMAKISSLGETKKAKSLSPDEFKNYCYNLFEFLEVKMK